MSQENVDLIRRMLDEGHNNPPALFDILDDEVVWEVGFLKIPDVGASQYHGPAGVSEFFRHWVGPFDEWGYEATDVIDAGDSVLVRINQWGRGKHSGATVASHFWEVLTVRDGKVVHVTHHFDKAEALEAVRLSG
jgi:ketosteroid isomerase-like protein